MKFYRSRDVKACVLVNAEFRSRPYSDAEASKVACGKDASPDLHLKYTFLYSQIEQVRRTKCGPSGENRTHT